MPDSAIYEPTVSPSYPIRHWFYTMLLGPVLLVLYQQITAEYPMQGIRFLPSLLFVFWIFGVVFSLPSLAVYWIVFRYVQVKFTSVPLLKLFLNIVVIFTVTITFFLIKGSMKYYGIFSYSSAAIVISIFLPIKPRNLPIE